MLNSLSLMDYLLPVHCKASETPVARSINKALPKKQRTSYLQTVVYGLAVLTKLNSETRQPTTEEIELLNLFDGFGKLAPVFNSGHDKNSTLQQALDAFSPNAYSTARRGVLSSFYTPESLVNHMWRTVQRLGCTEGNVLDPSIGNGIFAKLTPQSFKGKQYGIELDPVTYEFARHTTPNTKIYNQRFEDCHLPNTGNFSLVQSNIPFGSFKARSKEFGRVSIHSYFFLRALKELHEGGLVSFLTSAWFMDSSDSSVRQELAKNARLVSAVRLPSNTFDKKGANVTTDILIFQKVTGGEQNPSWIETKTYDDLTINTLFGDNPHLVAGELSKGNDFNHSSCEVTYSGTDLDAEIESILDAQSEAPVFFKNTTTKQVAKNWDLSSIATASKPNKTDHSINELANTDNTIFQLKQNGFIGIGCDNLKKRDRFLAYIRIKDALKSLIHAERCDLSSEIPKLRMALNNCYTRFVRSFGPLSRKVNRLQLRTCSHYLRCKGLELNYVNPVKAHAIPESFSNSPILTERVYTPPQKPTSAHNITEACAISMFELDEIDFDYISELLNLNPQAVERLAIEENVIFKNPKTERYELAVIYLSGNLNEKIELAKASGKEYQQHIQALTDALPPRIKSADISVTMGVEWIDPCHYSAFVSHLMGQQDCANVVLVNHRWHVLLTGHGNYYSKMRQWGTGRRDANLIIESALNHKPIVIKTDDAVDHVATTEANQKVEEVTEAFNAWIMRDAKRRAEITESYNKHCNSFVVPSFTAIAEHLVINNCNLNLRNYQLEAVSSALLKKSIMLDCCVGSGKTIITQAIAMKLREIYGKASRPVVVTTNSLVPQYASDFQANFPAANILVIEPGLSPTQREELLNIAITSDHDCIIIPESTFKALPAPIEMQMNIIKHEIEELEEALETSKENNITVKGIERKKELREEQLTDLSNKTEFDSISYEDLNPTLIIRDETQAVKNLGYTSQMSNVKGMGNSVGSQRAFDFYVKTKFTQAQNGGLVLATGTSLSNSILEATTWLRMIESDYKKTIAIDSFIKTFAHPIQEFEIDVSGRNMRLSTSIKKFTNLPELLRIYRSSATVLSQEQLEDRLPNLADGRPAIPPYKNGKVTNEILEISPEQNQTFEWLVTKAKNSSKEFPMLKVMDIARKTSLDFRHIHPHRRTNNNVIDNIVKNVVRIHNEHKSFNGNQIVFADRGIPLRHRASAKKEIADLFKRAEKGEEDAIRLTEGLDRKSALEELSTDFSFYDDLTSELKGHGLTVAVVHDYNTPILKSKLKADFNAGRIDVLIGSTERLGTGWNLNERLVALHHGDLPLREGDFKQRMGRIRRANSRCYEAGFYNEVEVLTYSTTQTLDTWFLNLLHKKGEFTRAFNNGTLTIDSKRTYEPEDESVDFASLAAIVSGNPQLMELMKSQHKLKKLNLQLQAYNNRIFNAENSLDYFPKRIESLTNDMPKYITDTHASQRFIADPIITMQGQSPESAGKALNDIISIYRHRRDLEVTTLANYGDFTLTLSKSEYYNRYSLKGANTYTLNIPNCNAGGRAIDNAVMKKIKQLTELQSTVEDEISRCQLEQTSAEVEINEQFPHYEEIERLKKVISTIQLELANKQSEEQAEAKAEKESKKETA
ncbi:DEAD/DEAH box helicase family protein [Vibrio breoganii]|uniref:DEAD/DEAH box helicase family protein n=1 Tax=Vibrio breoganii TaxID=553239 RepID=UPI000CBE5B43|nr:DEAD/DEAH box helicase family protein [Vibrio breoganii]PML13944.1 hypothetical protein BCT84_12350 [Vibrio breoganii]